MTSESVMLKTRDIAIGGSGISLISIILIAVGGGAIILSVVGVTFYVLHVRRKRRRRHLIPQAKAGESILIKAPNSIKGVVDAKGMTPAMRMAADVRRISHEQSRWSHHDSRTSGERISAYRDNMIPPSAHARIMQTLPSTSSQYSFTSSSGPYPHSSEGMSTTYSTYSQQAGSYASVDMPPLPINSHQLIQKAQSQNTQKPPSVKSIKISRKPIYPDGEIQQEIQQEVQYLPQLPQPVALQQRPIPSLNTALPGPQRSLSPHPAASINDSESFTPVLDLGMEFDGHRSDQESPFELDNSVMEQSSWLASALDNAFNSDGPSFEEPPRRAPQVPKPVVYAPKGHTSKASISSTKSHSKKASKSSRPPPPATGPPKKHEKPTTGGPSRVTVDYYTPYSRRTLYQEGQAAEKVETLARNEALSSNQAQETEAGRMSVESAVRTAALFSSMEPVLQSNNNSLDLSLDRSSFSQIDHGGSFSAIQDGNSTIHTSVIDGDQSRRSNSSEGHKRPIPTVTFDHTTEEEMIPSDLRSNLAEDRQPFSRNLPALQIPSDLIEECQAAISSDDKNVPLMNTFDNNGLQKTISNKPSFASNLRAKLSMSRSKSSNSATSSGGRASPNPTQAEESSIVASRSPQLGAISGVSPALSSNSFMDGTPNSFGPPTETWNLSTDDIEMPQFVQRSSSSIEAERVSPVNPGLGLQSESEKTIEKLRPSNSLKRKGSNASKRSLKQTAMINRNQQRQSAFSLERNSSISSYGSSSQSHDHNRAFPWSRMQGPSSMKQNDTYEVIEEEHRKSNNSSPRFADAEPNSSERTSAESVGYNVVAASSMDHTSSAIQAIQAHDQGQQQKWLNLNRDVQRDSIASSYCDTILSSEAGDTEAAFDYENAQDQRAKLLQSIQKRQQAKQALSGGHGRSSSRQIVNKQPIREELEGQQGGFTSHSARLSIEVGQNASPTKTKFSGNDLQALKINMGEPFLSGHGILTPPLTPYEKTIALPELEVEQPPEHARIKKQVSLTAEERQAERLSKLRPLSLATNQAGAPASPLPHLNQSSHRSNASRSSSAFGLSPSTSFGSGFSTGLQLSSINYATTPTRPLFSTASKRVSRAGSATGSINNHGPMGVARSAGLSIQVSNASPNSILINTLPGLPNLESDSQASTPKATTFANAQMLRARPTLSSSNTPVISTNAIQQSWLSAANSNIGDGRAPSPSGMSVHRLSGSSFASNTSLLNRFPGTVNVPMV